MTTILIRTVIVYFILILSMRLMGKRQIGELEVSDLVTTLLLSEIAALPITDSSIPVLYAVIPIITLLTFEVLSSFILARVPSLKNFISARPEILVKNGSPDRRAMMRSRLSLDELISELRQNGITDINDVRYAILEQNGKITVIPKLSEKPPSASDLGLNVKDNGITHIIISDGTVNSYNLKKLGLSREKIDNELKKKKKQVSDIYLMLTDDNGKFTVIGKDGGII